MGCSSCGGKNRGSVEYVAKFKDGSTKTYTNQRDAEAAVNSRGGTYTVRRKL